jgi:hypothetical protein
VEPRPHKLVMADPRTPATVLLVIVTDVLGSEWLQWDPETVTMELRQGFQLELPTVNINKLMAAKRLVTEDVFYQQLPDFIELCNVLTNGVFDPREFDPADTGEISWGITEALLIWPPDPKDEEPFSQDIVQYIGYALDEEGIMDPPDVLRLGVRDSSVWSDVQSDFSDDPLMFGAIYGAEQGKTDEINTLVKERLRFLLEQLDVLELENGEPANAAQTLLQTLRREAEEEPASAI